MTDSREGRSKTSGAHESLVKLMLGKKYMIEMQTCDINLSEHKKTFIKPENNN